jgi:hypothetical protein
MVYYQKQSTCLIQFPSISQWLSSQRLKNLSRKLHLERQENVNSQGNIHQKEQWWRYHNTWLQTILQSNNNKNSMVLAQKQIWRPVEQNRGPEFESTQPSPPYFWQKCEKYMMEIRQPLQEMLLGKVVTHLQKTETRSMYTTL